MALPHLSADRRDEIIEALRIGESVELASLTDESARELSARLEGFGFIVDRLASAAVMESATSAYEAAPVRDRTDVVGLLARLAELRDAGVLTDQEFTEKKADLLREL